MSIKKDIESFMLSYENNNVIEEFYNEISLQLELGTYLRALGYKVYFEKNIKEYLYLSNKNITKDELKTINNKIVKSEIDLVIFDKNKKYAIELKYPRNGAYPNQMNYFLKDMEFLKQVKDTCKFDKCYALTVVDDSNFYNSSKDNKRLNVTSKPYKYFRIGINKEFDIKYKNVSTKIKWNKLNKKAAVKVEISKDLKFKTESENLCYYLAEID